MKLKFRLLFFLLTVVFLLANSQFVLAADANLYLSPSSATVAKDCYPTLSVMLDTGGQETTGVDAIIYYTKSKVSVDSITEGDLYGNYPAHEDVSDQGKIVIQAVTEADETFKTTAGSAQTFATIKFKSIAYGTANISFKYLGKGDTTDSNVSSVGGADIIGTIGDASVIVEDGASCPGVNNNNGDDSSSTSNPTATPTIYQTPVSGVIDRTVGLSLAGISLFLFSAALTWLKK